MNVSLPITSQTKPILGGIGQPIPVRSEIAYFQNGIYDWFMINGRKFPWRRHGTSLYKLIVTEILLQRTRAEVVASFYEHFFMLYPTWKALAQADENQVGHTLKPLGLWRQRAPRLISLAKIMDKRGGQFPATEDEINSLPAVGQYVANAIKLFKENKSVPLLDTNMARVLERYFGPRKLVDIRYDLYLQKLARNVIEKSPASVKMNWAILDVAALICKKKKPLCEVCPVGKCCKFKQSMSDPDY